MSFKGSNKMKKYINKNIILNTIINFTFMILIEIIFKIVNFFNLIDISSIRIILGSFIISFIISSIEYFIPKKLHKYINILFIFVCSFYSWLETGFNNFIGVYMSFGTSSQLGAVIDYIREFVLSFKWYYYFTMLPFILIILYYIFYDKKIKNKYKINISKNNYKLLNKTMFVKKILLSFMLLNIISSLYLITVFAPFMQNKLQVVKTKELLINPIVPSITVKQ